MACYKPIKAFRTPNGVVFSELRRYNIIGDAEIPCGMCIGCRLQHSQDWTMRCMHEAQMHTENCAVTLTYSPGNLPPNGSLEHGDYQLFMKRLRKYQTLQGKTARYYMCGEYGEQNLRPHYHANLFGVDMPDQKWKGRSKSGKDYFTSNILEELWGLGQVSVQPLTKETAGYTTRYIMKKQLGTNRSDKYERITEDGEIVQVEPEYARMSLKPGIGATWFEKFGNDVFPQDYVVVEGTKQRVPDYYNKIVKGDTSVDLDGIEWMRQQRAMKARPDNTDERRKVREIVQIAKIRNLKREL